MRVFFSVLVSSVLALCHAQTVLVFGDSLSAGYQMPAQQAWPALLEPELQKQQASWRVINASISGETSAGGLTRFQNTLTLHQPQWVILELGANDGLRGLPIEQLSDNLAKMIEQAQAKQIQVHLVGIMLPPNYGMQYTQKFNALFAQLATQYSLSITPFLLEPIIDNTDYFLEDQLHPTAAAQPLLMQHILKDMPIKGQ